MTPTTPERLEVSRDHSVYMSMTQDTYSQPPEIRDALLKQSVEARLIELEKQFMGQKQSLDTLKEERDRALRWGIIALGTAVMGMGTWIVNLFTSGHIR